MREPRRRATYIPLDDEPTALQAHALIAVARAIHIMQQGASLALRSITKD